VAFSDRKAPKDLGGVLHCLEHYLEDDKRRYGVDHDGEGVLYEYTCAYLLGMDGRPFLDEPISQIVRAVLARFDARDEDIAGVLAREPGRLVVEDRDRIEIVGLFRWYRLGTRL
jgi:hypothetical protein